jgi:hypothetical protein
MDMPDTDDDDGYEPLIEVLNKGNGYGSIFNYADEAGKRNMEFGTASEWCRSIRTEFFLKASEPILNPDDPPDCFVKIDGECFGVELVQLIEESHKSRATRGETPYHGALFSDGQWSKERFISKLNEVIQKKGVKYCKAGKFIDVLLIHTAETWLTSALALDWLDGISPMPHTNIRNAFLLLEYESGREVECWPVLYLYGDRLRGKMKS